MLLVVHFCTQGSQGLGLIFRENVRAKKEAKKKERKNA
jgi:hypothetical protein